MIHLFNIVLIFDYYMYYYKHNISATYSVAIFKYALLFLVDTGYILLIAVIFVLAMLFVLFLLNLCIPDRGWNYQPLDGSNKRLTDVSTSQSQGASDIFLAIK